MNRKIILDEEQLTPYKLGRIIGMVYVITDMPDMMHGREARKDDNRMILAFKCTDVQYQAAVEVIEKVYPGVIIYEES